MINGAVIDCGLLAAEGVLSFDLVQAWDTYPTYSVLGTVCFLVPCKEQEEGVMHAQGRASWSFLLPAGRRLVLTGSGFLLGVCWRLLMKAWSSGTLFSPSTVSPCPPNCDAFIESVLNICELI